MQRSFDEMGTALSEVSFCVLDIETTGGSPSDLGITEIGAVRYIGGEEVGRFQTLVNPRQPIPAFITVLTGITHPMVVGAPPIAEVMPSLIEFVEGSIIVGHNVRYDMSFLDAAAERLGYGRLPNRSLDTAALARRLVRGEVRNLKLASLAAHFRSPTTPNHRALDDAKATAHVLWCLLERAGAVGVTHLEDLLQLPRAKGTPNYRKIALSDDLPRRPGIYLFRDRNDQVFYVGKAKNLRSRVRSYFYGDGRRSVTNMLQELASIDHVVCSTELEAEVLELRTIAEHGPRHNKRSKRPRSPHWLRLTDEPFPRLALARTSHQPGLMHLGPFRGRNAARLVMEAIWDALPIRRCTGKAGRRSAACAFAQLGVASCPCDGSLSQIDYRGVIDVLLEAVDSSPDSLLGPLAARMEQLARSDRFEEAAWVRDRQRALGRALERRRAWQAMCNAGVISAAGPDGGAVIAGGGLVSAWPQADHPPLIHNLESIDATEVPRTVAAAEEAHLVWRWLTSGEVHLLESDRPVHLPRAPISLSARIAV